MTVQQQVEQQYKEAFKSNDRATVSALRMLKSAFKNQEIDLGRELTDAESLAIISREVKRRREAMGQYQKAGRAELAANEEQDITLFSQYLPAQMSPADVEALVREAVAAVGAKGPADVGKVMGALMPKVKGRADGAVVQASVKRALGA